MYVSCDKCGYDSGDCDSRQALAEKVVDDGGLFFQTPQGLHVECPSGHNGDEVRID